MLSFLCSTGNPYEVFQKVGKEGIFRSRPLSARCVIAVSISASTYCCFPTGSRVPGTDGMEFRGLGLHVPAFRLVPPY